MLPLVETCVIWWWPASSSPDCGCWSSALCECVQLMVDSVANAGRRHWVNALHYSPTYREGKKTRVLCFDVCS